MVLYLQSTTDTVSEKDPPVAIFGRTDLAERHSANVYRRSQFLWQRSVLAWKGSRLCALMNFSFKCFITASEASSTLKRSTSLSFNLASITVCTLESIKWKYCNTYLNSRNKRLSCMLLPAFMPRFASVVFVAFSNVLMSVVRLLCLQKSLKKNRYFGERIRAGLLTSFTTVADSRTRRKPFVDIRKSCAETLVCTDTLISFVWYPCGVKTLQSRFPIQYSSASIKLRTAFDEWSLFLTSLFLSNWNYRLWRFHPLLLLVISVCVCWYDYSRFFKQCNARVHSWDRITMTDRE